MALVRAELLSATTPGIRQHLVNRQRLTCPTADCKFTCQELQRHASGIITHSLNTARDTPEAESYVSYIFDGALGEDTQTHPRVFDKILPKDRHGEILCNPNCSSPARWSKLMLWSFPLVTSKLLFLQHPILELEKTRLSGRVNK